MPFFAVISTITADDTLLSVVQVFRHGERTPVMFYLTDPYKDSSYWDGLGTGQLTDHGKVQLVELGQYFRNRYGDFLSTSYSQGEISITSADTKRNLESAESFLTGLYPNENTSSIPIQTASPAVMGSLAECLSYDILYLEVESQEEYFKDINQENSEVYGYIREHSLFPVYDLMTANAIWDTLHIEAGVNYTLPEWTVSVFPEQLTKLSDAFALSLCYTEDQQKLAAGPFLNELIQYFEAVSSCPSSTEKVLLYSGHDVNIACFLNTFQAFTPHNPDFASSLIFELRQNAETTYVNAYYKRESEAVPITLKGCDFNCNLADLKSAFSNIVISEAEWLIKCVL
ncbi:hypothetical protein NQ317_017713 [Molorchus minor]|uniref:acid phosphatase n=1 Tax=Molorchus minor TaxID=1323400 RepID=A0ABQ9JGJ6_9CUCU|nr:hypothetical protein NQ317_017713 [Molorchus minor]